MSMIMGSFWVLGNFAGGPEVGAFVNAVLFLPGVIISTTTTLDAWGDYFRNPNRDRGDLIRAFGNTGLNVSGLVFPMTTVPFAIIGVYDANGNLNNFWNIFDE